MYFSSKNEFVRTIKPQKKEGRINERICKDLDSMIKYLALREGIKPAKWRNDALIEYAFKKGARYYTDENGETLIKYVTDNPYKK